MGQHDIPVALFGLAMAILLVRRGAVDALNETIENFRDNFRGGPPTPLHPLPGDDRVVLCRRRKTQLSKVGL